MTTATKAAAKTPVRKATVKATKPAPKPADKAAPTPAARKLRWTFDEGNDRTMAGKVAQYASVDGHEYAITREGDAWTATVTVDGVATVLSDTTFAKAYGACVEHNRAR